MFALRSALRLLSQLTTVAPMALSCLLAAPLPDYMFKRELLYIPFFGWVIALLDMTHIDSHRGADAFEEVVRQGTRKLADGRGIIMFPEGTHSRVESQSRDKSGGVRLAVRIGAAVAPIALDRGEAWPRNAFIKRPGVFTASISAPSHCGALAPEAIGERAQTWIASEMRRITAHAYAYAYAVQSEAHHA